MNKYHKMTTTKDESLKPLITRIKSFKSSFLTCSTGEWNKLRADFKKNI